MRCTTLLGCAFAALGCGGDADRRPSGETGTGTTTGASTSAEDSTSSTSTAASLGDEWGGTTTSDSASSSSATSSTDTGEESSGECPLGEQGCPCDDGTCIEGLACVADHCEPQMQCPPDAFEPNDSEAAAVSLGEIDDSDNDGGSVSGVLDHDGDADWYTYVGDDDAGSVVDPTRELVATGELRLCKFVECLNGLTSTEITCPGATDYALSPLGRPGCCDARGFSVPDVDCDGVAEDNMGVYLRIDQPSAQCVQYTINYHY